MRPKLVCLALTALAGGLIAWSLWPSANNIASAQIPGGGEVNAGRYKFIPGGLMTTIMLDTQTGKMYALTPGGMDGPFARDAAFAWVPIAKFEDLDTYRKWYGEQMQKFGRGRFNDMKRPADGAVPPPKVEDKAPAEKKIENFKDGKADTDKPK